MDTGGGGGGSLLLLFACHSFFFTFNVLNALVEWHLNVHTIKDYQTNSKGEATKYCFLNPRTLCIYFGDWTKTHSLITIRMKWSSFIICVSLLVWNFKLKTKQLTCTKKRQRPDKKSAHPTKLNLFLKCHVIYITKVIHTLWQLYLGFVDRFSSIINSFRIKSWWGMHRYCNLKSLNSEWIILRSWNFKKVREILEANWNFLVSWYTYQ